MKKYPECQRNDGLCGICSLSSFGKDCHGKEVNKLLYLRSQMNMTQGELAEKSGVNIRQIQRYESGSSELGNMTVKNAIAICNILECEVKDLI